MKTGNGNKIPMWAWFLTVLLGIPLAAALLRAGLRHVFHRLTALVLTSIILIALYAFLHWKLKSDPISAPMSAEDKKREMRKVDFCLALLFAAICLVGGVMFLYIAVFPPADLPSLSRWIIRVASLFIGLLSLVVASVFIAQCRMLVTGKRSLTVRFGKRHLDK